MSTNRPNVDEDSTHFNAANWVSWFVGFTRTSEPIRRFLALKSGQSGVDHGRAEVGALRRAYEPRSTIFSGFYRRFLLLNDHLQPELSFLMWEAAHGATDRILAEPGQL